MTNATNATRTKKQKSSVAEIYADTKSGVSAILDLIGKEMKRHEENAAKEPNNWRYVTEIEWLRCRFSEILMVLIGGEKELEVAKIINDHITTLQTARNAAKGDIEIGDKVHVKSQCFSQEFDAIVLEKSHDELGWNYRVNPIGDEEVLVAHEANGEIWVCDIEISKI